MLGVSVVHRCNCHTEICAGLWRELLFHAAELPAPHSCRVLVSPILRAEPANVLKCQCDVNARGPVHIRINYL